MLYPDDATGSDLEIPWEVHAPAPGVTEVTLRKGFFFCRDLTGSDFPLTSTGSDL